MKKRYLIINKRTLQYDNLIFYDEYLQNLFKKEILKKKKYYNFFKLNDVKKIDITSEQSHKKINRYRNELSKILNKIHNTRYNNKYWGLILDCFIYATVNPIIVDTIQLKKIYKRNKNIFISEESFSNFYLDSYDFWRSYFLDNRYAYVRSLIAEKIGYKILKEKQKVKFIKKKKFQTQENYILKFVRFLIKQYIKIFNPSLILHSYFGRKNDIKILLKSYGRILSIPSKFFFNYNISNTIKDFNIRNKIKVKEKDFIDKIFNIIVKEFMPASFLENYKKYEAESKTFRFLPLLGSAVLLIPDDNFKFLSAEVLNRKGKLITLQHGLVGKEKKEKEPFDRIFQKRYATKNFDWYDNETIKENFFDRYKKYDLLNLKKRTNILIYPTMTYDRPNIKRNLFLKNHPFLNKNYKFYESLNKNLKKRVKIKPFPGPGSEIVINHWKKMYGIKNLFIKNKKNLFNDFKIAIIDDVSTPLCELLYIGAPFILINNELDQLNKTALFKIKELKKINILFDDPKKAANFLNQNYDKLYDWWKKNMNNKIYLELKKEFLPNFKNSISLYAALKKI